MKKTLAPSILGLPNKKEIINKLVDKGYDFIHYDMMDGKFVENTSLPLEEVLELFSTTKSHTKDAHLMVANPREIIEKLVGKADFISFHADSVSLDEMNKIVEDFSSKTKLGIALNPGTPVSYISHLLDKLSFVLVMSVQAGRGGQSYMPEVEEKVSELVSRGMLVQMDGGLNDKTIERAFKIGAKVLVSGSYIVNNFEKENLIERYTL